MVSVLRNGWPTLILLSIKLIIKFIFNLVNPNYLWISSKSVSISCQMSFSLTSILEVIKFNDYKSWNFILGCYY